MSVLQLKWSKFIPPDHSNPSSKQIAFLSLPHREAFYGGAAGGGKLLAKGGVLLTPFGWKKCEDLQVGDRINNPDGSISRIIQLKAWEKLTKWVVNFDDGTSTEVAEEHLWLAWRSGTRKKIQGEAQFGIDGAEVITTRELAEWSEFAKKQETAGQRPCWPLIPVCEPQRFNVSYKHPSTLAPYILGALLGDGCITSSTVKFSCSVEDYQNHWKQELPVEHKFDLKASKLCGDLRFVGSDRSYLVAELKKLKLLGTNSHTKFVPRQYLYGTIENRIALFQGLMDTDGFVNTRGQLYYCSVSEQLRKDVCFLVRSLGGVAKEFDGNEIYIKLPFKINPCRILRKLERWKDKNKSLSKRVVSVVKGGSITGRCLSVSHPNGLYITNDFIVTHNSDALLMQQLRYCDMPGFKGLLIRRSVKEAKQSGAILNRAKEWLSPFTRSGEVKFNTSESTFYFCDGAASLQFGYLENEDDEENYQGGDWIQVGFDELTHFHLHQYTYLFTRNRYGKNNEHLAGVVPIQIRGAGNPGSRGHAWVKERFGITKQQDGTYRGMNPKRPFVQARLEDNPHMAQKLLYEKQLAETDPLRYSRLRWGDWDASPDSVFKQGWFANRWRRKLSSGDSPYLSADPEVAKAMGTFPSPGKNIESPYYHLYHNEVGSEGESSAASNPLNSRSHILSNDRGLRIFHEKDVLLFTTVDSASSERTGIEDRVLSKNKDQEPSWSVCSLWGMTNDFDLLWLDMIRGQWTIPDLIERIVKFHKRQKSPPAFALIESNGVGQGVYQTVRSKGIVVRDLPVNSDKITRSIPAQDRAAMGKIWLPVWMPWLPTLEDELFIWGGKKTEVCDQIDTLSLAANYVAHKAHGNEMDSLLASGTHISSPALRSGVEAVEGSLAGAGYHRLRGVSYGYRHSHAASSPAYQSSSGYTGSSETPDAIVASGRVGVVPSARSTRLQGSSSRRGRNRGLII